MNSSIIFVCKNGKAQKSGPHSRPDLVKNYNQLTPKTAQKKGSKIFGVDCDNAGSFGPFLNNKKGTWSSPVLCFK
ncbi:hypothetical protein, partial [Lacticaseibacillus yichunensis]|uniref:hypothetical protein n=1 Tax=Lacticaseibacillus yichunensis TaxID=2486015 RepID=UPI001CDCF42F